MTEINSKRGETTPILKSEGNDITYDEVINQNAKSMSTRHPELFHTRSEEAKDYKLIMKTALSHNKVLMSQSILGLKVHEPENQPAWTKTDRLFKLKYLIIAVGILYILITNVNKLNTPKSSNIKIATFVSKSYPMSSALTPVKFFYQFEKEDIKNRMDCELKYQIPACLD